MRPLPLTLTAASLALLVASALAAVPSPPSPGAAPSSTAPLPAAAQPTTAADLPATARPSTAPVAPPLAPASPAAASTAVPSGPFPLPAPPPSPYDSDSSLPAHADKVVEYTLNAKLDPVAHTVHGEGTIRFRNASSQPVRELWMHLYLNAFKNERSVFLREPVGRGSRGSTLPTTWGHIDVHKLTLREGPQNAPAELWPGAELHRPDDADETDARVPLPRDVAPGETITLDMTWDDKLPSIVERTGFDESFHLVGQWFPKLARLEPSGKWGHFPFHHLAEFYADYGTFDVTLDVPESYILGASGPAVEAKIENGRRIKRHVQGDIHDFAWTAWDKWQTASETIEGVAVSMLYPPGFRVVALRELSAMRFTLKHFNTLYGRYPYPTLTMAHPPQSADEAGGMEYPTFITTGGPWFGPPGVFAVELVTIHEYGHQYFYGLVGTDESTYPFLDEGMNSYATQEGLEALRSPGSIVDLAGLSVSDPEAEAVASNQAVHNEVVAQPAGSFTDGADYGRLVYARTSTIMETMRRVYGDEAVARAMGRYTRKYRFQHPTPDDFLASMEEALGPKVRETIRKALFDRGWVDYVVTAVQDTETADALGEFDVNGKRDTVTTATKTGGHQGWALVTRRGTLNIPVEIELTLEGGTTQRTVWDGEGDSIRVPYTGTLALKGAVVDPDDKVLLDQRRTNNFKSVGDRGGGAPRTKERLLYWAQLMMQAVSP